MLYVVFFLIMIILFNFVLYLIHKDTSIVDGEIIRIDKILNLKFNTISRQTYKTTIIYSYIVNNKKYISTMIDDFKISNLFYKYIKTESNKKILKDEYIYYVKKKDIKVRYKIHNPQDSKINNFLLRAFIYFFVLGIIHSLIVAWILWIILNNCSMG